MNNDTSPSLLAEQIAYYRERASEYDEWFLRVGRYDRGEEQNRQWFGEVEQVRQALAQFAPTGRVLEFAGGWLGFRPYFQYQAGVAVAKEPGNDRGYRLSVLK